MRLSTRLNGEHYSFRDIREVMGKANEEKSGDKLAGVAAHSPQERVAARLVLSGLRVKDICENPAVPYEQDEVTRLILDGLNSHIYNEIADLPIGSLRELILKSKPWELERLRRGLSSEVIAYPDLGPEAIHRFVIKDFPVIVLIDSLGNNLYESGPKLYKQTDL